MLLALLAGVGAVLWQSQKTAQEAERANATLEYVLGMFEAVDPVELEGGDLAPEALLAPGLRRAAALDGQPLVQASLMEGLGRLGVSLGLFPTADSLLTRAVEIRSREQGPNHRDLGRPLTLLVHSLTAERRYDAAVARGEEAVRVLASGGNALAEAQIALAEVYYRQNEAARAAALYRSARRHATEPAARTQALLGLATQMSELDSLDAALPLFRAATRDARDAFGPTDPRTADALYDYADALQMSGDDARARGIHEQALAVYEQVYGRGDYRTGRSLYTLAVLLNASDPPEAERYYRDALTAYEASALEDDHLWREYARVGLGGLLLNTGRPAEALPLLESGEQLFAAQLGADDSRTVSARAKRGRALVEMGQTASGVRVLQRVEARLAETEPENPMRAPLLDYLEATLTRAGRTAEARVAARTRAAL